MWDVFEVDVQGQRSGKTTTSIKKVGLSTPKDTHALVAKLSTKPHSPAEEGQQAWSKEDNEQEVHLDLHDRFPAQCQPLDIDDLFTNKKDIPRIYCAW